VAIASPANNASFTAPASMSFTIAASDSDGTIARVDLLQNGTVIQSQTSPPSSSPFTFSLTGVAAGDYTMTARATDNAQGTSISSPVVVHVTNPTGGLPIPWQTADVGAVGVAGSASYANGTFTLKGSGIDIWDTADGFRFLYQPMTGNGEIRARVTA